MRFLKNYEVPYELLFLISDANEFLGCIGRRLLAEDRDRFLDIGSIIVSDIAPKGTAEILINEIEKDPTHGVKKYVMTLPPSMHNFIATAKLMGYIETKPGKLEKKVSYGNIYNRP